MTNSVSSGLVVKRLRNDRDNEMGCGQHQHAGGDQCRRCGRCRFSRCEERVPEWCVAGCREPQADCWRRAFPPVVSERWTSHGDATPPQLSRVGRRFILSCLRQEAARHKGRRCRGADQQFPEKTTNPSNSALAQPDRPKRVREEMLAAHLLYPSPERSRQCRRLKARMPCAGTECQRPPARKATWP